MTRRPSSGSPKAPWVPTFQPVDPVIPQLAAAHRLVVTVEDNGRVGGVGATIAQALRDARVRTPLRDLGLPQRFLEHGTRAEVLAEAGLTPWDVAREIMQELDVASAWLDGAYMVGVTSGGG